MVTTVPSCVAATVSPQVAAAEMTPLRLCRCAIEQRTIGYLGATAKLVIPLYELEKAGGLAYLGTLAQNVPSAANIRRYAEIVRERAIMRKLVEVGSEIATSAYNPGGRSA